MHSPTTIPTQELDRYIDDQLARIEHTLANNIVDSGTLRMRRWLREGTMTEREYWAMLRRVAGIVEQDLLNAVPKDRRQEVKGRIRDTYRRASAQLSTRRAS